MQVAQHRSASIIADLESDSEPAIRPSHSLANSSGHRFFTQRTFQVLLSLSFRRARFSHSGPVGVAENQKRELLHEV